MQQTKTFKFKVVELLYIHCQKHKAAGRATETSEMLAFAIFACNTAGFPQPSCMFIVFSVLNFIPSGIKKV